MQRRNLIAYFGACICALGIVFTAFSFSSVSAEQPPRMGCAAVSKQEYDSAKRQKLLRSRFSTYLRTGRLGQRHYWYCHS
jgi:hypothetical protein